MHKKLLSYKKSYFLYFFIVIFTISFFNGHAKINNKNLSSLSGIYYVKPTSSGLADGSSWANASSDLQSIINNASSGEQIWVAAGTYYPTTDYFGSLTPSDNRTKSFILKNGVMLYGGFSGTETLLNQRNFNINSSILSGDLGTIETDTDNAYHVVIANNLGNSTVFDGFTVRDGTNSLNSFFVINYGGNNFASYFGAGLYNFNSNYTVKNSTFINNKARSNGGAICCQNSGAVVATLDVEDCKFFQNEIASSPGSACIYNSPSYTCNINRCIFDGNTGGGIGGFGDYNVDSSVFINNGTNSGDTAGGAISIRKGNLTVKNSVFENNRATYGGAIYTSNVTGEATSKIYNCTFYNNYAISGVALSVRYSVIANCIFYENNGFSPSSKVIASNSISETSVLYSLINSSQIQASSSNLISGSPAFADVSDLDGEDDIWGTADDGLMITAGSAAFNTGTNASPYALTNDIVGTTRPQYLTIDLGAYESPVNLSNANFDSLTNLKLYPNPTNDSFILSMSEEVKNNLKSVEIYNYLGQKVKGFPIQESYSIQEMTPGIYFVKLIDNSNIELQNIRIIKS